MAFKKAQLMSSSKLAEQAGLPDKAGKVAQPSAKPVAAPVFRETIESFAVALILAFLFRAFVAEAFVIPTGSMAPTLMGAHKDVTCPECSFGYQSGASSEFTPLGQLTDNVVVGSICPLCRYQLPLDLKGNANHATFSGDRILVSKFAYLWREPKRWEVIVFKYPKEARQNYIKRLVGTPSERLQVRHGDIHVQPLDSSKPFEIARKPANIVGAVLQPIHDTSYLPKSLVKAGLPSAFQPFPQNVESTSAWKVSQSTDDWNATCESKDSEKIAWLRYFHRVVDPKLWTHVRAKGAFPVPLNPYSSRLITDFTHYNGSLSIGADQVYEYEKVEQRDNRGNTQTLMKRTSKFNDKYKSGESLESQGMEAVHRTNVENDGLHWVGDLASEFDIEVGSSSGTIVLDLVEFGIHHRCQIDVATGQGTIQLIHEESPKEAILDGKGGFVSQATTSTPIRGAGNYRIRISNFDDQITLWVGGRPLELSPSGRFSTEKIIADQERYPHWSPEDPLDGAPVGLGSIGAKLKVSRARVWRDIYYIAVRGHSIYNDYDASGRSFEKSVNEIQKSQYLSSIDPERKGDSYSQNQALLRDTLYSSPELWKNAVAFSNRRSVDFSIEKDQYFPMGDNSAESFDARGWDVKYVPEKLLIGRAVMVFWPHYWNRPIPFTPNVQRMGLIR